MATAGRPDWVSDELFPFESRFFETPDGQRMHYVDEGSGTPIVFVHGNPAWSFEFRQLIEGLRSDFRCIAPDHIGFGLSSRSGRREDHHPAAHAERFAALLDHLEVRDATLFLTDWGGPIGLEFARRHPHRVARIVIANTWCWPVADDRHFVMFSFMMRSWLGQFLIKRFNFFVTQVMPRAVGDKAVLTPEVMSHYRNAQPTPEARAACAAFPGHIVGASDWLRSIWDERATFRRQAGLAPLGLPRHRLPREGARPLEVRAVRRAGAHIRGLRPLPRRGGARADPAGAARLHVGTAAFRVARHDRGLNATTDPATLARARTGQHEAPDWADRGCLMSEDGKPLAGKVAIVAGATRGIGHDIALYLARARPPRRSSPPAAARSRTRGGP